jgi:hypothetical protein
MKKVYLLYLFLFFQSFFSFSQPGIEWQRTIGGDSIDWFYTLEPTADGGYILGGYSMSNAVANKTENNIGLFDYWIVKTDSIGNIQWQNTIGGTDDDIIRSVHQTSDGGYIMGGYSVSNISGDKTENCWGGQFDYWIVKTDSLGNIQWQKTIGGTLDDRLWFVNQTTDGGYILGGHSNSNISGNKTENRVGGADYWVVKTDSLGNIQWQNTIGGTNDDYLYSMQQTSDGGYILAGSSRSNSNGDKTENTHGQDDYWIVKINSVGNIVWQNDIGASDNDLLFSIQQTTDGGFILGGFSNSDAAWDKTEDDYGWFDYWIVKTDASGTVQWDNTIGGDSIDYLYSIRQTADGGYILGGHSGSEISGDKTESMIGGTDYWIIKTDNLGNIEWQNTIGGTVNEDCRAIRPTADEGIIVGGSSYSGISGDKNESNRGFNDYWIVKIYHRFRVSGILQSNVLCNGDSTGVAIAAASGGAPPYTYNWTPSGGSSATASLSAGSYTVSITDLVGMDTVIFITITQPPLLTSSITSQMDAICNGGTGSASVLANGGFGTYSYEWNSVPVQNTDTATNLFAGTYTVTVTDANGCTSTNEVNITEPPALISYIVSQTNVACGGDSTGSAKVFANGGTPALTFSWNTVPVQTNATAINLAAGTYTVTVTDANGCTTSSSVTITEPPPLASVITLQIDVSCFGSGSAAVAASGGTGSYTFEWNTIPPQLTDTATNLDTGSYTVIVTDANGCTTTASVIITAPPSVTSTISAHTDVLCNGDSSGTATVTANGGSVPYTYEWNTTPAQTTDTAFNLTAGIYSVIVTDASGCTSVAEVTIIEPPLLVLIDSITDASCSSCCDGSITPTVSGGIPPYTYTFSCGPSTNVCPGTYICCVVDSNGCSACDTIVISYPTDINEMEASGLSIHPNPAKNIFTIELNQKLNLRDAELKIFDVTGRIVLRQSLISSSVIINSSFSVGVYLIMIYGAEKVYKGKLIIE